MTVVLSRRCGNVENVENNIACTIDFFSIDSPELIKTLTLPMHLEILIVLEFARESFLTSSLFVNIACMNFHNSPLNMAYYVRYLLIVFVLHFLNNYLLKVIWHFNLKNAKTLLDHIVHVF